MATSMSQTQETSLVPRVQVRCTGIDAHDSTIDSVRQVTQQVLYADSGEVVLAVVQVERTKHGLHRCDTQLFGRELQHVAGYAEHHDPVEAAAQSVQRALRVLRTGERFSPWTSTHPGCQRGEARPK